MSKVNPDVWTKHLQPDTEMMMGVENGGEPVKFTVPHSLISWFEYMREVAPALEKAGCPRNEILYVGERILILCESCLDRYQKQYDAIRFWDFMNADLLSPPTQNLFIKLITSGILAAEPKLSSLKTIGKLLVRMFIKISSESMVANLDGPTTLTWIDPWVKKILEKKNVFVHFDHELISIEAQNQFVKSVTFKHKDISNQTVIHNDGEDSFIIAIPAERMAQVIKNNDSIKKQAPSLANIDKLFVNHQNGLQFFLKRDIPMAVGHVSFSYSKWSVTSVSQAQFWKGYNWTAVGDGTVKGILSVDVSAWNLPGEPDGPSKGRTGNDVDRDTYVREVWYQMHKSIPQYIPENMDEVVHTYFLDPDIQVNPEGKLEGQEPLFINTVNASQIQPESYTEISNLFLASDYTNTDFNVACMEAANESGRRAVNALLTAYKSPNRSKIFDWPWPTEFVIPQQLDCKRMKDGLMPIGWDVKPYEFDYENSLTAKYMRLYFGH